MRSILARASEHTSGSLDSTRNSYYVQTFSTTMRSDGFVPKKQVIDLTRIKAEVLESKAMMTTTTSTTGIFNRTKTCYSSFVGDRYGATSSTTPSESKGSFHYSQKHIKTSPNQAFFGVMKSASTSAAKGSGGGTTAVVAAAGSTIASTQSIASSYRADCATSSPRKPYNRREDLKAQLKHMFELRANGVYKKQLRQKQQQQQLESLLQKQQSKPLQKEESLSQERIWQSRTGSLPRLLMDSKENDREKLHGYFTGKLGGASAAWVQSQNSSSAQPQPLSAPVVVEKDFFDRVEDFQKKMRGIHNQMRLKSTRVDSEVASQQLQQQQHEQYDYRHLNTSLDIVKHTMASAAHAARKQQKGLEEMGKNRSINQDSTNISVNPEQQLIQEMEESTTRLTELLKHVAGHKRKCFFEQGEVSSRRNIMLENFQDFNTPSKNAWVGGTQSPLGTNRSQASCAQHRSLQPSSFIRSSVMSGLQHRSQASPEKRTGQLQLSSSQRQIAFSGGISYERKLRIRFRNTIHQIISKLKRLKLTFSEVIEQNVFPSTPFERVGSKTFISNVKANFLDKVTSMVLINRYHVYNFDFTNSTGLHWAAKRNLVDMILLLCENGSDIEAQDIRGRTPLFLAVYRCQLDAVRILLAIGSSPRIKSEEPIFENPEDENCASILDLLKKSRHVNWQCHTFGQILILAQERVSSIQQTKLHTMMKMRDHSRRKDYWMSNLLTVFSTSGRNSFPSDPSLDLLKKLKPKHYSIQVS